MASKKILAIGGPRHGTWLPDLGMQEYRVPIPRKVSFSTLESPLYDDPVEVASYIRDSLYDHKTKKKRSIYRYSEMNGGKAYEALRTWLVDMFINAEPDE